MLTVIFGGRKEYLMHNPNSPVRASPVALEAKRFNYKNKKEVKEKMMRESEHEQNSDFSSDRYSVEITKNEQNPSSHFFP
jgi:hypothetical protein